MATVKKAIEVVKSKCITWHMLDKIIVSTDDICKDHGFEVGQVTADLGGRRVTIIFEDREEE